MKESLCDNFQNTVAQYLIRHQSILDILTKSQESNSRINRAVAKATTTCGCIRVKTSKQQVTPDSNLHELKELLDTHLEGELCESCREIVENELGKSLFYLTALCNSLGISLYDVLLKEHKKVSTLRVFNLT